jgi:phosphoribosylaminoimidazole-succinocarboxamide synthase
MSTTTKTQYNFPGQTKVYYGKVRDVYTIHDEYLVMIASDRISAFDVILPRPIPFKGQVLNKTATEFLNLTRHICPNWLISVPAPHVAIGYKCVPYRVEMVIRGYLTGHAWREYKSGKRMLCGVPMPDGLRENDPFPEPIITPATKAEEGHDMDISREEIISQGIVPEAEYIQLENYTRALYKFGTLHAQNQGLILVDTKYEFGNLNGQVTLIDEIHTPDSSRYFYLDTYAHNQEKGEPQQHLSKEFVREWLIQHNFMGHDGQQVPPMSDDFVTSVSERYIHLYEKVTGKTFVKEDIENTEEKIAEALRKLAE